MLLNGRRVAAHGISSTEDGVPAMSVNVNTLPTRGLERVDILRDGASAMYGSDAVAGVINFVTDSSYVGNEVQVQTGITEIGSARIWASRSRTATMPSMSACTGSRRSTTSSARS